MHRDRGQASFTLIELVLVMVVICTALAIASPSLRGWRAASKMRDAGDQFFAITRHARAQAIANSQIWRLTIDANSGSYQLSLQDSRQFVSPGTEFGQVFTVPDGCRLTVSDPGGKAMQTIDFYPDGQTQPGTVRIAYEQINDAVEISCPSPVESYDLVARQSH